MSKICSHCNINLTFDKFRKLTSKSGKIYYRNICKKCVVIKRRDYYKQKHRERSKKDITVKKTDDLELKLTIFIQI